MDRIYYQDSGLRTIKCTVTFSDGLNIKTDRTVFYPEGGGQSGDRGFLGPHEVVNTKKADDGDSILVLAEKAEIKVGEQYELSLDWEHRYNGMVVHTCQHLLSGLLYSDCGIGTVSVHMGEGFLTIETDREETDEKLIRAVVDHANKVISQRVCVFSYETDYEKALSLNLRREIKVRGKVRIVEIEGVDRIACGGVHVSDTGQLRFVIYTGHERIRGHERLCFICGEEAVRSAVANASRMGEICRILSCSPEEAVVKIREYENRTAVLKNEEISLKNALALYRLKERVRNGIAVYASDSNEDLSATGRCVEDFPDLALCTVQEKDGKNLWLIALKGRYESLPFSVLRSELLSCFNARGGGKGPVYQGIIDSSGESGPVEKFLEKFRQLVFRYVKTE